MKIEQYIRCPRCELNFIKKKDKLCSVCKAELAADPNDLDEMEMETCPICKTNFIRPDEIMCKACLKERSLDEVITSNSDDDWDNYVNPDEEDITNEDEETGDMASITDLGADDIDELEIDDSDLPDIGEDINFDDDDKDDDDDDDDFDDDDDDDDFDDLDDDED